MTAVTVHPVKPVRAGTRPFAPQAVRAFGTAIGRAHERIVQASSPCSPDAGLLRDRLGSLPAERHQDEALRWSARERRIV